MIIAKLAFRSLLRRKGRMLLIGSMILAGTVLLVVGGTFASSAKVGSKEAIIQYFTGDFILYSEKSKDLPSPFSFSTPLPVVEKVDEIQSWLDTRPEVLSYASFSQNFGQIQVKRAGESYDLPFIFYAVDPPRYAKTFENVPTPQGTFFQDSQGNTVPGVVISEHQNKAYQDKYGVTLAPGDKVTLLSLTGGGSVNAVPSTVTGIYDPVYYKNVFDYLNYMDMETYSQLFNFSGVTAGSVPDSFTQAMAATSDEDIFGLADSQALTLNTDTLEQQKLTGYTMVAVRLKDSEKTEQFLEALKAQGWPVKAALWSEASTFFAQIADILQMVIWGATGLIFLITAFILMNTQIINIIERTGEIGTLRAIGAEKGFVINLFMWESLILNGTAALVGMVVSLGIILAFSGSGVPLPEIMSQYLVGGGPLKLILSPWPFLTALVMILALSFLATLYPTRVAASISPLTAMNAR